MRKFFLRDLIERQWKLQEQGDMTTLLGIGPMSERVIRCSLELARDKDFPLMLIASRNQISEAGGYVKGWNQRAFVDKVKSIAEQAGFDGILYLCRDHGGPWQMDEERIARLPLNEAMERARNSFREDLRAGFNVLHVDPTKDPHVQGLLDLNTVIDRTVQLIAWLEEDRIALGVDRIGIEVGTEETSGGLIAADAFGQFLEKLRKRLETESLPLPELIVGQTGTLVKADRNVGCFDGPAAQTLTRIAKERGTGFKEHNADYLSDEVLAVHPRLALTSANVAPEFGVEETRGFLELARKEVQLGQRSSFVEILGKAAIECGRWRKWLPPDKEGISETELLSSPELKDLMIQVTGHYVFDDPQVTLAREEMLRNLKAAGIEDAERSVDQRVKTAIDRYIRHFNLVNFTSKIHRVT